MSSENVVHIQDIPLRQFFAKLEDFKVKVFTKKGMKVKIFDVLKIRFGFYVQRNFYVCCNMFTFYVSYVPDFFTDG